MKESGFDQPARIARLQAVGVIERIYGPNIVIEMGMGLEGPEPSRLVIQKRRIQIHAAQNASHFRANRPILIPNSND